MKLSLPQLSFAAILFLGTQLSAQHNHQYDSLATALQFDSVDYPGFAYFMEHGEHPRSPNRSEMRYQPSEGAPLFLNNGGFESGDFTSWTGMIGDNTVSSLGPLQNAQPGIYTGAINPSITDNTARHSIMQLPGAGIDPTGQFPCVPAGYGNNTARLGNTYATYQGQSIEQTFVVNPQDTAFVYSYAVVMYDGSHPNSEACYFMIEILDQSSSTIFFRQDLSSALPSTYVNGSNAEWYLPWESDTIDLSTFVGQNVTIRFTTSGCIWSGHWCYAYVDCDPNSANTIGIEEHAHQSMNVYPNPSANGVYHVNCTIDNETAVPQVFDGAGRNVNAICMQTSNGWNIDISHMPKGSYFAQIPTSDGVKHCNLIH